MEQHILSTTVFAIFLTVSHIAICKILVGSVMVHVANNMLMKSTKVQTLGAYCMSCSSPAYYANARARKMATPRVVAGAVSVLAPTRASDISKHSFGQG